MEPFNEWFNSLFELDDHVWHCGMDNNTTRLLAALFAYKTRVRYNHQRGNENGQIHWISDIRRIAGHPHRTKRDMLFHPAGLGTDSSAMAHA